MTDKRYVEEEVMFDFIQNFKIINTDNIYGKISTEDLT